MNAKELRRLLADRGLAPRSRLGQNFLIDPALLASIPRDAGVRPGDRVLEVGPGPGGLTEVLLAAGASVLAVEFDRGLAGLLRERLGVREDGAGHGAPGALRLIEGDVLAPGERLHPEVEAWWDDGPAPRVVSNLPYSISGPFLARLPGRALRGACLLLQREVARKAAGGPGGKDYGPLSVRLSLAFTVRVGRRVPPEVFWPRPAVESAFLLLEPRADAPSGGTDLALKLLLETAFRERRKRLLPRLRRSHPSAAAELEAAGVAEDARPEVVPPETWRAAARALESPGS